MAASAWTIVNSAKEFIGDGTIDLDNDTFKLALFTTGYTPSATQQTFGAIATDEIVHASYTDGGETLAGVTWSRTAGQVVFDANDVAITSTAGELSAKYAVIYDDSTATAGDPVTDAILCYSNLSSTGGDVSVTQDNTLTIKFATTGGGIFTAS
jgi:hypothetical protein